MGICLLTVGGLSPGLLGETVTLRPVADTAIFEAAPANNLGGQPFFTAGTTQNNTKTRGLFRFDLPGPIPSNSKIISVNLSVEVTGQPKDDFAASSFELRRVFKSWGEGNKTGTTLSPGLGAPATTNEATWNSRFAFTTNTWSSPGGAETNDYSGVVSAEQFIYGISNSPYTFESNPRLVSDVQTWLDNPPANFGWLLKTADESVPFTARRFASREDANNAPRLEIEYLPPPRIQGAVASGTNFVLRFTAEAGQPYAVQFRNFVSSGAWSTLTNFTAQMITTNIFVSDSISASQRFYRITIP